jgi:DNA polymerase elongation subunit (family B)
MSQLEPLEFQLYDYMEDHEFDEDEDDEDSSETNSEIGSYIIHTFGRTLEGKSVYMRVLNYNPHFYIKLPLNWTKDEAKDKVKKMLSFFTSNANKKVWTKYRSSLINMEVVERMAAEGFTNGKKFLFAKMIFNNLIAMKKYKFMLEENTINIYGVTKGEVQFKTYEANLPPMLRCFHIKKISGCSWVSVKKYVEEKTEDCRESYCDIELRVDWRDVMPIEKDTNAPFRILSFDIECYSSDKDKFPQARNKADCIFQIGSTYTLLNESVPYRQHIVCLRETDPVEGSIVEWYKEEKEMVKAWISEVINQDCDIITGWNIFGFDEGYIYDRCKEHLNLEEEILRISKLKKYKCEFRDFKLESAAFGQNKIRMFGTPGRIHIDLMKDVQKNFKLNSYKLDMVASNFIRNEIYKIEKLDNNRLLLCCDGIDSIFKEDFIHVEYALDFISEMIGYKYKIEEIDKANKTLIIKHSDALLEYIDGKQFSTWNNTPRKEREFKIFWSQAKDDVSPQDIFRMFNGTSAERAIVAKYCIKDCTLINLLIDKLCVVTNNIEMANVCYVPMSFLFTRGQLIKLFSLCLKNYMDAGYLFPVLKKPDEKSPSYEGAIVFDPEANVEYEALAVKDYASLYPSSIIHKNMSHETIIKLDKYDNIDNANGINITYFNAQFKDHDNSIQHRRFAKVGDELGVVPKTLRNLIDERNAVKKVMKGCKDQFKYKILDGKQLALKITANSLYGALGADVSPIFQRDIAACTTSTGREMLKLARHFDENIVPGLLNGYRYALYNKDEDKANKILDMEMKDPTDNELRGKIKKYVMNDINKYTFQPIIRYGDSVTADTLVYIKYKNEIEIIEIGKLEEYYKDNLKKCIIGEKEYYKTLDTIETYSDVGWTPIKYIMKHKTDKMILNITTTSGSVKVTSDHSCILKSGTVVKPINLNIGDELLTAIIDDKILREQMSINNLNYRNKSGIITKIEIIHNPELNIYNKFNKNYEYVYDFETENHHFMAGNGNIVVHNTDSIFSCYRFREDVKQVKDTAALPLWKDIIGFSKRLFKYFIPEEYKELWENLHNKYYNDDLVELEEVKCEGKSVALLRVPQGPSYKEPPSHFKNVPPLEERMEQFLLHYMEESFMPWLWIIQDIFTKKYVQKETKENAIEMKLYNNGISMVEKMNLVCDLSDDVKEIILEDVEYFIENKLKTYIIQPYWDIHNHNSDIKIVRVRFYKHGTKIIDKRTLTLSIDMGVITGELVKKRLPFPHDLEYEKTFWPFLILTKKRYVGNKYEFNPDKYKQDYNGIVLKRRDNAPIVKEICGGIINRLIDDKDPDKARQFTIDCMNSMFNNEYNIKYFLTSKTLKMKESYADWTKIAHVVLANRIAMRDPGNCPQSGDRIEFAAIQLPNVTKNTLQGERIETPQYIKEKNLKIDFEFYMTNQIMNPALQFLSLVIPNAEEIFDKFKIKIENEKKGRSDIMSFIKRK